MHRSLDCKKKAIMLEEVKELEHEDGEPIFDQPSNEVGGDFEEEEGLTTCDEEDSSCSKIQFQRRLVENQNFLYNLQHWRKSL